MRARAAIATTVVLLALTACSSNDSPSNATASSGHPTSAATSSTPAPKALDAEQVVKALADAIPTAKPATVYTAATDKNHLLGRPGGYASKADWTDQRAKPDLDDEVQLGGSVEVFDDPADAKKRDAYIAEILKAAPVFGAEYHYVKDGILLRVSGALTPAQAAEYEAALKNIG